MQEKIKKILEIAVNAPSGDNAQPWRFEVQDNVIYLHNDPEADKTLYNFRQRGDFIAHGAILENIILAANHEGYQGLITLFPDSANPKLVAMISLERATPKTDPLYDSILKRATNRKPYKNLGLTADQRDLLVHSSQTPGGARLILLEDKAKITALAAILSWNERLILENYYIHKGLFSYIRWTKEEEAQYQTGLFIKTLELKAPQEFAFKIFRHWSVIKLLGKLGIPKLVAKDSAKLYASTAAFGMIVLENNRDQDFVIAGRILQKIWLTATSLGLSLQPTAALLYLAQRILAGETKEFSKEQIEMIKQADKNLKTLFEVTTGQPAMLFRVGVSDPPSARSLKRQSAFEIL